MIWSLLMLQDKTTPLINAATSGFTDVVQLLVDDARVNVNLKDRVRASLLYYVVLYHAAALYWSPPLTHDLARRHCSSTRPR